MFSLIQLFFVIFKNYSKAPIPKNLKYNHVFWALIFEQFSFTHEKMKSKLCLENIDIDTICSTINGGYEMHKIIENLKQLKVK